MKRRILAFAACAALGLFAADVKLATREWVTQQIRKSVTGRRATATVVTANADGTFTYSSPFHSDEYTNATHISLTFTPITREDAQPVRSRGITLMAASTGKPTFRFQLVGGSITLNNEEYRFTNTLSFEFQNELPDLPDNTHTHDPNPTDECRCKDFANRYATGSDNMIFAQGETPAIPSEYYPPENWRNDWAKMSAWVDQENWQYTFVNRRGETVYYFPITFVDGSTYKLSFDDLSGADAWYDVTNDWAEKAEEQTQGIIRWYIACEVNYALSHTCSSTESFHRKVTTTCGQYSWTICDNGCGYREGTERHDYPGSVYNASWHSCKCQTGPTEGHGTLVPDGERTRDRLDADVGVSEGMRAL